MCSNCCSASKLFRFYKGKESKRKRGKEGGPPFVHLLIVKEDGDLLLLPNDLEECVGPDDLDFVRQLEGVGVGEEGDDVVGAECVAVEGLGIAAAEEGEGGVVPNAVTSRDFATEHLFS